MARNFRNGPISGIHLGPRKHYVSIYARDASRKIQLGPYTKQMREYVYAYLCMARGYVPRNIKVDIRELEGIEWDKDVQDLHDLITNMLPVDDMSCPLCGSSKLWVRKGLDNIYFCWNCRYEFKVEVIREPTDQNIVAPRVREGTKGDQDICIARSRRRV